MENQVAPWQSEMCPYQACEGMLVEAEKLSSMATMNSQPGSYVRLLDMGMGQDWAGEPAAAPACTASRPTEGEHLSVAAAETIILLGSNEWHIAGLHLHSLKCKRFQ